MNGAETHYKQMKMVRSGEVEITETGNSFFQKFVHEMEKCYGMECMVWEVLFLFD